jgi:hypothetical protein
VKLWERQDSIAPLTPERRDEADAGQDCRVYLGQR